MDWSQNYAKVYRAFLYFYPAEFRHEYGEEMEQLFQDRLHMEQGWRLLVDTLTDIAINAPKEHFAILLSDLKHEARSLCSMPGFSVIVLLVMALGIGTTVSIFSMVNAVLLRSLPFGAPERLVYLWSPNSNFKGAPDELDVRVPDFYHWQRSSHSFSAMALFNPRPMHLVQGNSVSPIGTATVTADFFHTLEVKPAMGRPIDANDDQPGHERVAVVSNDFWLVRLHGRPDVLGSHIQLNRQTYTVIGVMPPDFAYPLDGDLPHRKSEFKQTDVWLPAGYTSNQTTDRMDFEEAIAIARLKDKSTVAAAQAELRADEASLQPLYEPMWRGWTALVKPLVQTILGPVEQMFWLLWGSSASFS